MNYVHIVDIYSLATGILTKSEKKFSFRMHFVFHSHNDECLSLCRKRCGVDIVFCIHSFILLFTRVHHSSWLMVVSLLYYCSQLWPIFFSSSRSDICTSKRSKTKTNSIKLSVIIIWAAPRSVFIMWKKKIKKNHTLHKCRYRSLSVAFIR